ncbi:MAG: hydroxymethylglutaryl-CoA lyase [Acidobacteriota bacterium]
MQPVVLHEVGLRDGLQIEEATVPTDRKLAWLARLMTTGVDLIQLGSFVNPKRVPQMADTDDLFRQVARVSVPAEVTLSALVLNEKGLERGADCGVSYFCMGVSASNTHSEKNTGMGTMEAAGRIVAMGRQALSAGAGVQVSVQSAFGCGFEGPIPESRVLDLVRRFLDAGLTTVSLADSAGHADPAQVRDLFGAVADMGRGVTMTCHFHNTYGLALANAFAALEAGVTCFESAFGGLGGCPFTAVAAGNLCTEDLVHLLHRVNLRRDVTLDPLLEVVKDAEAFFGRALPGVIHATGPIPHGGRFAPARAATSPERGSAT